MESQSQNPEFRINSAYPIFTIFKVQIRSRFCTGIFQLWSPFSSQGILCSQNIGVACHTSRI